MASRREGIKSLGEGEDGAVTAQDNCQEQKEKHLGLCVGGGRELGGKEGPVVPS